jgi:hypothetical protein
VRRKLIVLGIVAASIGAAAAVASGSHSQPRAHVRVAPAVMRPLPRAVPRRSAVRHVFKPPVVEVRAVKVLPPTGFGLGSVAALALALVAAGLLFRQLAAGL